jgi:hypothetical protein
VDREHFPFVIYHFSFGLRTVFAVDGRFAGLSVSDDGKLEAFRKEGSKAEE